jgi:hypothetical protein
MASSEVLDRDLLFRKMKTKPDNKVLLPVACLPRPLLLLYADESCILVMLHFNFSRASPRCTFGFVSLHGIECAACI